MSPMVHWILQLQFFFTRGFGPVFYACLLEGKRVPTFPGRLCRRQSQRLGPKGSIVPRLTGLQFTPTLGKALALLTKHGLEIKRQKEFPVEVVMESLLSKSPLMVAAAPDMDVMSCIEHFLEHCVDGEGQVADKFAEMSVGSLIRGGLRGGWKYHVLTTSDFAQLRRKAKRCLQVRVWV